MIRCKDHLEAICQQSVLESCLHAGAIQIISNSGMQLCLLIMYSSCKTMKENGQIKSTDFPRHGSEAII